MIRPLDSSAFSKPGIPSSFEEEDEEEDEEEEEDSSFSSAASQASKSFSRIFCRAEPPAAARKQENKSNSEAMYQAPHIIHLRARKRFRNHTAGRKPTILIVGNLLIRGIEEHIQATFFGQVHSLSVLAPSSFYLFWCAVRMWVRLKLS
jgi:hypothetical protein